MANPKHIAKPATAAAPKLTDEERAAQIARFFTQKREQFFMMALGNLLQAGTEPHQAVDLALETADRAIEKLYPVPKEGETK
jgi:hypothetical protein